MTNTTQEELPPLPHTEYKIGLEPAYDGSDMQDYARQCIATLKAELAQWKPKDGAEWTDNEWLRNQLAMAYEMQEAAQSQAAAMAGLLERLRRYGGARRYWTGEIDAALAAWKGKQ